MARESGNKGNGQLLEASITRFARLRSALQEHYEDRGRSIPLATITLARDQQRDLLDSLFLEGVEAKLQRIVERQRGHKDVDPVATLVAGRLFTALGQPKGAHLKRDARMLMSHLATSESATEGEHKEREVKNVLTHEQLTAAMDLVEFGYIEVEESVADQLDRPLTLPTTGLSITLTRKETDPEERGFALPETLLDILESLKHVESADVLRDWTEINLASDRRDECIQTLRALVQFSGFLDQTTYYELFNNGEGKVLLLPLHSMYAGISEGIRQLKAVSATEEVRQLEVVQDLMAIRYKQALTQEMLGQTLAEPDKVLTPTTDDLALTVLDWVGQENERRQLTNMPSLTNQQIAICASKIIEQTGVSEVDSFCADMAEFEPDIAQEVHREAVRSGLTEGAPALARATQQETLQSLIERPWIDAGDEQTDFSKIIDPETELLRVGIITGTLGSAHEGHLDLVRRGLAHLDYLQALDATEGIKSQSLILVAPILDVDREKNDGRSGYNKNPVETGWIDERAMSAMLLLSETDRERVFLTTTMQPNPAEASNTYQNIVVTANNLEDKISRDFREAERLRSVRTATIVIMGSDELQWQPHNGNSVILDAKNQPKKTTLPHVIVGRHGSLLNLIQQHRRLQTETNCQAVVLSPDTANKSSSEERQRSQKGNFSSVRPAMIPFLQKHYSEKARKRRAKGWGKPNEARSITELCQALITEYQDLIE